MSEEDFWGAEFEKMRQNPELWTSNADIQAYIYKRITGGENIHWLPWVFNRLHNEGVTLDSVLSVGCGDGEHEKHMLSHAAVKHVHGMDASPGAVETASAKLKEVAQDSGKTFKVEVSDLNYLNLEEVRADMAACIHIAHHVADLDNLFFQLRRALIDSQGPLVLMEYIGPNRFQWTERQTYIVERLREALAEDYLNELGSQTFRPPTFSGLFSLDPSEACSSEDIMKYLKRYFDVSYESYYNGALLHPMYGLLNPGAVGERGFDTLVRVLIVLDEMLSEFGLLAPDFIFLIAWPKHSGPA